MYAISNIFVYFNPVSFFLFLCARRAFQVCSINTHTQNSQGQKNEKAKNEKKKTDFPIENGVVAKS